MSKKRVILSDSSLNRYGYRVLTSGMNIEPYKKNPILLYMHFRDEGSPYWGEKKAIGFFDELQLDGDELSGIPVFDKVDDDSKILAAKYEAGTYRAFSVGIRIIATSANKDLLLPGQTRETVTECELMEVSLVDIPANTNAVRLYDRSTSALLATGLETNAVPELSIENQNKTMKLKVEWPAFLSFLNIGRENADKTELTDESLGLLHTEMERLKTEHGTLVDAKKEIDTKLSTAESEVTTLKTDLQTKETEITSLKNDSATKDTEIAQLKEQVKNLKAAPAAGAGDPTPKGEPEGNGNVETLAAFTEANDGDHITIAKRLKEEGLA